MATETLGAHLRNLLSPYQCLLDVIPGGQVNRMAYTDKYEASSWYNSDFEPAYYVEGCDNAIDACYELILKLHKNNIL